MSFKPIITLLHNQKLNRWHPTFFAAAPLQGEQHTPDKPTRHKATARHTIGYETRETALETIPSLKNTIPGSRPSLDKDIPWDGETNTPAMICFFVETPNGPTPTL